MDIKQPLDNDTQHIAEHAKEFLSYAIEMQKELYGMTNVSVIEEMINDFFPKIKSLREYTCMASRCGLPYAEKFMYDIAEISRESIINFAVDYEMVMICKDIFCCELLNFICKMVIACKDILFLVSKVNHQNCV